MNCLGESLYTGSVVDFVVIAVLRSYYCRPETHDEPETERGAPNHRNLSAAQVILRPTRVSMGLSGELFKNCPSNGTIKPNNLPTNRGIPAAVWTVLHIICIL